MNDEPAGIEGVFSFKRDALSSDYIVMCEFVLGENRVSYDQIRMRGMKVFTVGSLDKDAQALLEAHRQREFEERNKVTEVIPQTEEKVVKMKRKR
jgi:hypothetical protein